MPLLVGDPRRARCVAFVFALVLGVPDAEAARRLPGDRHHLGGRDRAVRRTIGRLRELFNLTGGAQGIPGSQYRDPFTDLSFFGDGNTTLLPFNYLDVADGSAASG